MRGKGKFGVMALIIGAAMTTVPAAASAPTRLVGEIGSSPRWASGWIEFPTTVNFSRGDVLKLSIGGSATKIVARLLPKGVDPNLPESIVGGIITVPKDRVVELRLNADYREIRQVSVHGGSNPWDQFPLGTGNGMATLLAIERTKH